MKYKHLILFLLLVILLLFSFRNLTPISINGYSMNYCGFVVIKSDFTLIKGKVYAYKFNDSVNVFHRLIDIKGDWLLFKGDNNLFFDDWIDSSIVYAQFVGGFSCSNQLKAVEDLQNVDRTFS